MPKPKIFISYHRADNKYKDTIVQILKKYGYHYFSVNENKNFNGWKHQHIADYICSEMENCDILLCIVGKDTYSRPHVDFEIHTALKGDVGERKGIIAVMLETRYDSKNNINYNTFPTKLKDNFDYIVLEQYASIATRIEKAIERANKNRNDIRIQTTHKNRVMELRTDKYYDN